jgi:hypothetical protein
LTPSDSVQRAYRWAFNTLNERKSGIMHLYCAKQIALIVESGGDKYEDAYGKIVEVLFGLSRGLWKRLIKDQTKAAAALPCSHLNNAWPSSSGPSAARLGLDPRRAS